MPYSGHGKTPASGVSRGDIPRYARIERELVHIATCPRFLEDDRLLRKQVKEIGQTLEATRCSQTKQQNLR